MSDPTLPGSTGPQPAPGGGSPQAQQPASAQPVPGLPGTTPPPAPPRQRKGLSGWVIAGIVAGVLTLLCCGAGSVILIASGGDDARRGTRAAEASEPPAPAEQAAEDGDAAPQAGAGEEPGGDEEPAGDENQRDTFDMPPGSTLIVTNAEGTLEITVESFEARDTPCDEYGLPPENGVYLIADVRVEVTEGTGSINPFDFTWVADDGTTADAFSGVLSGCGPELDSAYDMRTGSRRSGTLVFDVADDAGALEYQSGWFGGANGSWRP